MSKGLAAGFSAALLKIHDPSAVIPTFLSKALEEVLKQECLSYVIPHYHRRLRPLEAGGVGALGGYVKGLLSGKDPFQELLLGFVSEYFFELFLRIYVYLSEDEHVLGLLSKVLGVALTDPLLAHFTDSPSWKASDEQDRDTVGT